MLCLTFILGILMKQKIALFLGCFLASSVFAASTIKIGVIYNTSGSQAVLDQRSLQGAKLAVDEINMHGGVLGKKIQLEIAKGDSKTDFIQLLAGKMASKTLVPVVVGLSDNDMVEAAAPPILQAGKVFITSGATSPQLLTEFPKRFFLTAFTDNAQAAAAAQFAIKAMHRSRAIVLYQQNMTYTRDLAYYFVAAFKHFNGKILYQQSINNDNLPIAKLIAWQKSPGTILFLSAGPEMAPKLIKRLRDAGIKLPIFGGDSYVADNIVTQDQQAATDIYFTTHGYFDKAFMQSNMRKFVIDYRKKYGQLPQSIFTALGYDAIQLAVAGIRKAGSTNPQQISLAIKSLHDFPAVTGELNLNGAIPIKTVTLVKIIAGRVRIAALVIPQYIPKTIPLKQTRIRSVVNLKHHLANVTGEG